MIRCIRVEQLLVEKNNRRKGYGTKIMKCFFEMIKDKKMDVGLQCVENNKIGRKFFRKMKFRRTGKQHFIITFGEIEKYY
jgi:GNAT superfamily N-acetyltransferase